jgi:dihydropteroate synthase
MRRAFALSFGDHVLDLGRRTAVMGILNVTPDSFFDGGRYHDDVESAVRRGVEMAAQGADLIDVGGESTRPGADPVGADEEASRILPVIGELRRRVTVPVCVDTRKADVAEAAVAAGARMINDVGGLRDDPRMAAVIAKTGVPCVIMHKRGDPRRMQEDTRYSDLVSEVHAFFTESLSLAGGRGIPRTRILLDPGIGFGKDLDGNLRLLRHLDAFHDLDCPILVGVSRKSFIGRLLDKEPGERLHGTSAAVALAVFLGAHVVRVHDVAEMTQVAAVADAVSAAGE